MTTTLTRQLMFVAGLVVFPSYALARTWSDSSGKFRIEANLERIYEDRIALRKNDGSLQSVPINRLSDTDQKYIQGLIDQRNARLAAAQQSENRETVAQNSQLGVVPTKPTGDRSAAAGVDRQEHTLDDDARTSARANLPNKTPSSVVTSTPQTTGTVSVASPEQPEPTPREQPLATSEIASDIAAIGDAAANADGAAPLASDATATVTPSANTPAWSPGLLSRLILLVILGIAAYGFGYAVGLGAIGVGIGYGVCQSQNLPLASTIIASLALAYCVPAFLIILFSKKPLVLFSFLLFPGAPALLASHFWFGTTWFWSVLDGAMIWLLLPAGIAMFVARGRANSAPTTSSVSASVSPRPYTPSTTSSYSSNSYVAMSDAPQPMGRSELRRID